MAETSQKKKTTGKAPAFQFYPGDWIADTRCLSLAAKGAWIDALAKMWLEGRRGEITYPTIGFARLFGCSAEQAEAVIKELTDMGVCDSVTQSNGNVTLISRRMSREFRERELNNNRQKRFRENQSRENNGEDNGDRNGKNNGTVTSYSSTSSSNIRYSQAHNGAERAADDLPKNAGAEPSDPKPAATASSEQDPVQRRIWTDGLELLIRSGWKSESSARSFLGKLAKENGKGLLAEAIAATQAENPVNPQEFLVGLLKQRKEERNGRMGGSDAERASSAVNRVALAANLADELARRGIPTE